MFSIVLSRITARISRDTERLSRIEVDVRIREKRDRNVVIRQRTDRIRSVM